MRAGDTLADRQSVPSVFHPSGGFLTASPSPAACAPAGLALGGGAYGHHGPGGAVSWLLLPQVQMIRTRGLRSCQFPCAVWASGQWCLLETLDGSVNRRRLDRSQRFAGRGCTEATRGGEPTARLAALSSAPPTRRVEPSGARTRVSRCPPGVPIVPHRHGSRGGGVIATQTTCRDRTRNGEPLGISMR